MKSIKTIILIVLAALWHLVKYICNGVFKFLLTEYKKNPQILWLPILFVVWAIVSFILRWIDPTAGIFDLGIFMIPVYAIIIFLISTLFVWIFLKKVYGTIYSYLKDKEGFKSDFKTLQPCTKIVISFSVFFLLLFCLIALMGVL